MYYQAYLLKRRLNLSLNFFFNLLRSSLEYLDN